jgi:hypothetical protein
MKRVHAGEIVDKIKKLYFGDLLSMSEVARKLHVSIDSVTYLMRKNNIKRRSFAAANKIVFKNKPASFRVKGNKSKSEKLLEIAGLMLYWAEGYKSEKSGGIDFANSDPRMIRVFINFLRSSYTLDESRFRIFIYCCANQDIVALTNFWSNLTKVPKSQFTKPYIKNDFRDDGRIMQYGMIHVRYSDKKLLVDLMQKMSYYINVFNA